MSHKKNDHCSDNATTRITQQTRIYRKKTPNSEPDKIHKLLNPQSLISNLKPCATPENRTEPKARREKSIPAGEGEPGPNQQAAGLFAGERRNLIKKPWAFIRVPSMNPPRPSIYPLLDPKCPLFGTIYPYLRVQGGSWLLFCGYRPRASSSNSYSNSIRQTRSLSPKPPNLKASTQEPVN